MFGPQVWVMCRNIRTLSNFEPPATDEEIEAAALQYVRKISGCRKPSVANERAFREAVDSIARASRVLIDSFQTKAPPRNREEEKARAIARNKKRFG